MRQHILPNFLLAVKQSLRFGMVTYLLFLPSSGFDSLVASTFLSTFSGSFYELEKALNCRELLNAF
jgi:hypothetical protein